jgi:tape measure domain-containing protein
MAATLGTLMLRMRADRKTLEYDLRQTESMVQDYSTRMNKSLNSALSLSLNIDESKLTGAFDSVRKHYADLVQSLSNPLSVKVSTVGLIALSEEMRVVDADYDRLRRSFENALTLNYDPRPINRLQAQIKELSADHQINLSPKINQESLDDFRKQLSDYASANFIHISTQIDRIELDKLQYDLHLLGRTTTTHQIRTKVDGGLKNLMQQLKDIKDLDIKVGVKNATKGVKDKSINVTPVYKASGFAKSIERSINQGISSAFKGDIAGMVLKPVQSAFSDLFRWVSSGLRRSIDGSLSGISNIFGKIFGDVPTRSFDTVKQRHRELIDVVTKPLSIKVDDRRLTELNQHFKIKEKDYIYLQSIFDKALTIHVDDDQLVELQKRIRGLSTTNQVDLKAQVNDRALREFHEQLIQYTQAKTIDLATAVSGASLIQLQKDLKNLATGLTTARVAVQVDSELDSLRNQLKSLPSAIVKVKVDGSEVTKLNKMLDGGTVNLKINEQGSNDLSRSIEKAVHNGMKKGMVDDIFGAISAPIKSIARGALEKAGGAIAGGAGKSIAGIAQSVGGDTFGSIELVQQKLQEAAINKLKGENIPVPRLVTAAASHLQPKIVEFLGAENIANASNKVIGAKYRDNQFNGDIAKDGLVANYRESESRLSIATANKDDIQSRMSKLRSERKQKMIMLNDAIKQAEEAGSEDLKFFESRKKSLIDNIEFAIRMDGDDSGVKTARLEKVKAAKPKQSAVNVDQQKRQLNQLLGSNADFESNADKILSTANTDYEKALANHQQVQRNAELMGVKAVELPAMAAVQSNKNKGLAIRSSEADKELAKEGVMAELRAAHTAVNEQAGDGAQANRYARAMDARANKELPIVNQQLESLSASKDLATTSFDDRQKKLLEALNNKLEQSTDPNKSDRLKSRIQKVESARFNSADFDNEEIRLNNQKAGIIADQSSARSNVNSISESHQLNAERLAKAKKNADLLQRTTQPKVVQDILDEIAPGLPEHKIPKLVSEDLSSEGALADYNIPLNRVRVHPTLHKKLINNQQLSTDEYKSIREELEHAGDFKFGDHKGYEAHKENRFIGTKSSGTPEEEMAIADELSHYKKSDQESERYAKIRRNRGAEKYENQSLSASITDTVGLGGVRLESEFSSSRAAKGVSGLADFASGMGISFPSLKRLADKAEHLRENHQKIITNIGKMMAGELSNDELKQLVSSIEHQDKEMQSLEQRTDAVKEQILKSGKYGEKGAVHKFNTGKNKQISRNTLLANKGTFDNQIALYASPEPEHTEIVHHAKPENVAHEIVNDAQSIGGKVLSAADRAITPHVNNLLGQVPGQPGMLDYGQDIGSLSEMGGEQYSKIAQLALHGGKNALGNVAGIAQRGGAFLKGAENIALSMIPYGHAIKGGIKNTALPAAAFGAAAHFIPGGEVVAHGLQSAAHGLLSLPGAGLESAAGGLINSALGGVPGIGGSLASAGSALVGGAIDMATSGAASVVAPILGGKLMLNAGNQAFKAIAPHQDTSRMLAAGEHVGANLLPAAIQVPSQMMGGVNAAIEGGRNLGQAVVSKVITQSIEPLDTHLLAGQQQKALPSKSSQDYSGWGKPALPASQQTVDVGANDDALHDKFSNLLKGKTATKKQREDYAIGKIKSIRDAMDRGWKQLNEALANKDKTEADRIAGLLSDNLGKSEQYINGIVAEVGHLSGTGLKKFNSHRNAVTTRSAQLSRVVKDKGLDIGDDLAGMSLKNLVSNPGDVDFDKLFPPVPSSHNTENIKRPNPIAPPVPNPNAPIPPSQIVRPNPSAPPVPSSIKIVAPPQRLSLDGGGNNGGNPPRNPSNPDPGDYIGDPSAIERLERGNVFQRIRRKFSRRTFNQAVHTAKYGEYINPDASKAIGNFDQHEADFASAESAIEERIETGNKQGVGNRRKYKYSPTLNPQMAAQEAMQNFAKNHEAFGKAEDLLNGVGAESVSTGGKLDGLKSIAGNVIKTFGGFAILTVGIGLLKQFGEGAIDAAAKAQTLKLAAESVSSSRVQAARDIEATKKNASILGSNAVEDQRGNTAFKASVQGTSIEGLGTAPLEALRKFGATKGVDSNALKFASVGLTQMSAKGGPAEMEDIKQITEAVPGSAEAIARGMGMSVASFRRAQSEGGVSGADIAASVATQFGADAQGSLKAASGTYGAASGRLGNSINDAQVAAGNQVLPAATAGMNTAAAAADLLAKNMDVVGKMMLGALLAIGAGTAALMAGLGTATPLTAALAGGISGIGKAAFAAAPAMLAFAAQAALAYAAIEILSVAAKAVFGGSELKDEVDALVDSINKIPEAAANAGKSIEQIRDESFANKRSGGEKALDFVGGVISKVVTLGQSDDITGGGYTQIAKDKYDADVNRGNAAVSDILLNKENPEAVRQRKSEISNINNEIAIENAKKSRYTSADGAAEKASDKRIQDLTVKKVDLQSKDANEISKVEQALKLQRGIAANSSSTPEQIATANRSAGLLESRAVEIKSRFDRSTQDMIVNLNKLSSSFVTANQAIEKQSAERRINSQKAIASDPLNTGAATKLQYLDTAKEQGDKRQVAQSQVSSLEKVLGSGENSALLKQFKIDPKNYNQEDVDKLASQSGGQGKALLNFLPKYKEALNQLQTSDEALANNRTSYIKTLAEYDKQTVDKLISLKENFRSLINSSKAQLLQLEQSIADQLLEIDKTTASTVAKASKNKLQAAYNKFLQKLGTTTDDIFDTMFNGLNETLDIIEEIGQSRLGNTAAKQKANQRAESNLVKSRQTREEQNNKNDAADRELYDRKLQDARNNIGEAPGQSLGDAASNAVNTKYDVISGGRATRKETEVNTHHEGKAYHHETNQHGDEMYRSDGGKKRIVKDFVLGSNGNLNVPIPASVEGIARVKSDPGGYGNYVETQNEAGEVLARVAHMRNVLVKDGERVKRGQPLGIQGRTGHVTGSDGRHTHWEGEESTWDAYYEGLKTGNWGAGQSSTTPSPIDVTDHNGGQSSATAQSSLSDRPRKQKSKPAATNPYKRSYRSQPKSARLPMPINKPHTGDNDLDEATRSFDQVTNESKKTSASPFARSYRSQPGSKSDGKESKEFDQFTGDKVDDSYINTKDGGKETSKSKSKCDVCNGVYGVKCGAKGCGYANVSPPLSEFSQSIARSQPTQKQSTDIGSYRNPDGSINPLRNPDGTLDTINNPKYATPSNQSRQTQKSSSSVIESPYTNVMSSWYTPGQGGAINGGNEDIRGKYIDSNSLVMATRTTSSPQGLPYGSIVEVRDPRSGKTVKVSTTDRGTLRPGRDTDLTPAAAKRLGITPDGVTALQMRVISVPDGKIKPTYDLGGGIGRYDKKGNYTGASGTIVKTAPQIPQSNPSTNQEPLKGLSFGNDVDVLKYGVGNQENQNKLARETSEKFIEANDTALKKDVDVANTQSSATIEDNNEATRGLFGKAAILRQQNRNKQTLNRRNQQRREDTLIGESSAISGSRDRSQFKPIDELSTQYGGIRDTATIDQGVVSAQSTIQRARFDRTDRAQSIQDEIDRITALGTGFEESLKPRQEKIASLKKQGKKGEAQLLQDLLDDDTKLASSPQGRQQRINRLSEQQKALPSAGVYAYDAVAPGIKPAISAVKDLEEQYLPKSFDNKLNAEARGIVDKFASVRKEVSDRLKELDLVVGVLKEGIQEKLAAAGINIEARDIDATNPKQLELLKKVAPIDTQVLLGAEGNRRRLNAAGQLIDENAATAANRSISNARIRDDIKVDRLSLDSFNEKNQGNLYAPQQSDALKFQLGKRELDMDLKDGSISVAEYDQRLAQLKVTTDTLRNAMLPLRQSTNDFFTDISNGKDVFSGLGDAMRNFLISTLKQFQKMISEHLGQQLFGSLTEGARDVVNDKTPTNQVSIANIAKTGLGYLGLGDTRSGLGEQSSERRGATAKPLESFRSSDAAEINKLQPNFVQSLAGGAADYLAAKKELGAVGTPSQKAPSVGEGASLLKFAVGALGGLFGFADGGLVQSPTLSLVGEGVHNEAIVPLPNGRSIPVDLKGLGGGGETASAGAVNSSVAITIHNNGNQQEISRGDANNLSQMIKAAAYEVILNERRQGGILSR